MQRRWALEGWLAVWQVATRELQTEDSLCETSRQRTEWGGSVPGDAISSRGREEVWMTSLGKLLRLYHKDNQLSSAVKNPEMRGLCGLMSRGDCGRKRLSFTGAAHIQGDSFLLISFFSVLCL